MPPSVQYSRILIHLAGFARDSRFAHFLATVPPKLPTRPERFGRRDVFLVALGPILGREIRKTRPGVVVDDLRHGVDLIVRGEDLVSSTGRQLLLSQLLGRTTPFVTVHHPLVLALDGQKLSKRDRSETVRAMRERGMNCSGLLERAWGVAGMGQEV